MVRKSGENRENYQQNRRKSGKIFHIVSIGTASASVTNT